MGYKATMKEVDKLNMRVVSGRVFGKMADQICHRLQLRLRKRVGGVFPERGCLDGCISHRELIR